MCTFGVLGQCENPAAPKPPGSAEGVWRRGVEKKKNKKEGKKEKETKRKK